CWNCAKAERFLRRLLQAAVQIIKKMLPKASDFDLHSLRQFQQASAFFFAPFFFLCEYSEFSTQHFAPGSFIGHVRSLGRPRAWPIFNSGPSWDSSVHWRVGRSLR